MKELYKAIHKVQGAIVNIATDSSNPHFKSTYASLEHLISAIKPIWVEAGLFVTQFIDVEKKDLVTVVVHAESGEVEKFTYPIINQKGDLHGMGAAFTYSRRQAIKGIFGIAEEDDDGNKATKGPAKAPQGAAIERTPQKTASDSPPAPSAPKAPSERSQIPSVHGQGGITEPQWKRALKIASDAGWDKDTLTQALLQVANEGYGVHFKKLSNFDYNELCNAILAGSSAADIIKAKRG